MKLLLLISLITLMLSCNKKEGREEVLPDEGVTTVHTNQGNTYSKYCIMTTCYCQKSPGYNTSIKVDCDYFDEVQRLYNKFNHVGEN